MGKYTAWKMKAAICDDTVEDAEFMEKHIKEYFMKKSIPYECNVYQSSKALWYEIEDGQAFDLLFLDIEMQELNGFELAAKIQETAPDILIIFVSAYESYVYKSFVLHFPLSVPVCQYSIIRCFNCASRRSPMYNCCPVDKTIWLSLICFT